MLIGEIIPQNVSLILLWLCSLSLRWRRLIEVIEDIAFIFVFLGFMYTSILLVDGVVGLGIRSTKESIGCATFHYWCYFCDILLTLSERICRLHDVLTLIHLLLLLIIWEVGAAVRWRWSRCKLLGLFCKDLNSNFLRLRLLILRIFTTETTIGSKVFLIILEILFLWSSAASKER